MTAAPRAGLAPGARGYAPPMDHWDLPTLGIEPHRPQILHSTRGEARSIAIHLPAGERLLSQLAPREREVLRLRFVEDLTQSEIGERVGVSQMQVSRLLRQSLAQLHAAATGV